MTTARTIIKNRVRAGNTLLGVGCYSAAIQPKLSQDTIIKVGNATNDPWLIFYDEVISRYPDNIHLPKVHDIHIDHEHDYYVAVVERLNKHPDREYGDIIGTDSLEEVVRECSDMGYSFDDFAVKVVGNDCHLAYGEFNPAQLYEACKGIHAVKEGSYNTAYIDVCECEAEISDHCECGYHDLSVDLHANNFMYRSDGTIVINDPICDSDMDDVDDLNTWANEHAEKLNFDDED